MVQLTKQNSNGYKTNNKKHSTMTKRLTITAALLLSAIIAATAQTFTHYVTTQEHAWTRGGNAKAQKSANGTFAVATDEGQPIVKFRRWGTTFNELDYIALRRLKPAEQDEIMRRAFAPDGELRFSMGRISMNANDYSDGWYQCDSVAGDFGLKHFNIERDKLRIIPYVRMAQKYCPAMTFWLSPWSPPAWMKINHDYPVQSNRLNAMDRRQDYLLFGDDDRSVNEQVSPDKNCFPRRLATQDFLIQDPRYLQAYADMFCRFIDLYHEQGIDFRMVMYQNEAYSYTPYPGCPWTFEGIVRFNSEYLAPTLRANHPEVELCLGTINTNRYDHVHGLLSNPSLAACIKGVSFQWEGGQILPRIRKEFPQFRYIQSESECGNGRMDWQGGEHTFALINHYLGNGCSEYNNWNLILTDDGVSPWGWRQNALIRVDSKDNSYSYRPEYFAYRHYSQFISEGTSIVGFREGDGVPVLVALTPQGKRVVVAGNSTDQSTTVSVSLAHRYLNISLPPHSMHTFVEK